MKIAVLSGKGGAGKTFVATNLAMTSKMLAHSATYIDCDVEEPNGYLFLKPEGVHKEEIFTYIPHFDTKCCTGCKKCVNSCRFNALAFIKHVPLLFPDICHGCGACELVCEACAVSEAKHSVGFVEMGYRDALQVVTGIMHTGEVSAVPIIKKTLKKGFDIAFSNNAKNPFIVIDCPPGSACSVMESVQEADFCILVVEPTAFGVHNFKMVYELVSLLKKPCGIIINKEAKETVYEDLEIFCLENKINILARFEDKQSIAKITSNAEIAVLFDEELAELFKSLFERLASL